MKLRLLTLFALLLSLSLPAAARATQISDGMLIRGVSQSAVYYVKNGMRYVFPNAKVYDSWYSNSNTVVFLEDAELAMYPIGGNVTYRPSTRLLKIQSDPKVYAVSKGGVLRWVENEQVAVALFGSAWNGMVDDVPDAFFPSYTMGTPIAGITDYQRVNEVLACPDIGTCMTR